MKQYILLCILLLTSVVRADITSDLAERKAAFPLSPLAQSIDPYARDCATKYLRSVSAIPVKNIPAGVRIILAQIDADLRIYDTQCRGNPESRATGQMVLIARANAKWLREKVRPFVLSVAELK